MLLLVSSTHTHKLLAKANQEPKKLCGALWLWGSGFARDSITPHTIYMSYIYILYTIYFIAVNYKIHICEYFHVLGLVKNLFSVSITISQGLKVEF
jgi:hypothetical protein